MAELSDDRRPAVSVVMPVLNPHPAYFRQAVSSVLAQTLTDFELLIIEDPSPASAGALLADLADPRIRHVLNPERIGFARQINQGLELARSDLVARFDADDICEPDRLEKQEACLRAHPDLDVMSSHLAIIDPANRLLGYRLYPVDHDAIRRAFPRFCPIAHPAVIYRRERVLKAGGYHATRHKGTEDYDLWSRLMKAGLRFANYPECLVRYRIHPQSMKSEKLRDTLQGTLEVKRLYWMPEMTLRGRLRIWAERLLLWMPSRLVIRLFTATQFTARPPETPARASPLESRDGASAP